jgi:hypothetical protein
MDKYSEHREYQRWRERERERERENVIPGT